MNIKIKEEWLQSSGLYQCPFCKKEYSKNGIATHIWRSHGDGQNHDPNKGYKNKTRTIWNKGLTKNNNNSMKKMAKTLSINFTGKPGHKHSPETIEKLRKSGGYRPGSGRGKSGWYKGYWCDSSWELAFVIYNLEHNVEFIKNKEKFEYIFNGKKHNYIPDFIMKDGSYIEIKGYETEQTLSKHSQFPHKLIIISGKKQIKPYLDYVIEKYGKDFIKLYEHGGMADVDKAGD